ncbi:acyltransferase [Aerococcus urinaeequi]|uniref:acyltransferase n=1 Tax=Aerococcus urinaeequi TaxID=51665 RepID=UPI003B3AD852
MVTYNFVNGSEGIDESRNGKGYLKLGKLATIRFEGKANFAKGISVRCDSGVLNFGKNISTNRYCFISCSKSVKIEEGCSFGWNVQIRDSDGHDIHSLETGKITNAEDSSVYIGKNSWVAANVNILKGVHINHDSVVAYNSCVLKSFNESNVLIAGYPAVIKKRNIFWTK